MKIEIYDIIHMSNILYSAAIVTPDFFAGTYPHILIIVRSFDKIIDSGANKLVIRNNTAICLLASCRMFRES